MDEELHTWDQKVLKGPVYRIKNIQKELERVWRGPLTDDSIAAQKEIVVRLELLMEQEELTWIQRARANWLKHGDSNTNFFHHYASSRRKNNNIKGLVDDNGIRHEDSNTMRSMVHNYFAHLFQTEPYEINDDVLNAVKLKVTPEMNQGLLAPFSCDEVKYALF